jgi:ATP-dependent DNA helicase RecQ
VRPERHLVVAARAFLRSLPLTIEPRQRWTGVRTGSIGADLRLQPGRALAVAGDGGWGTAVKQARRDGGRFDDETVAAAVELIRTWAPDPTPEWVTWVPSGSGVDLVADSAQRIASALDLPVVEAARRTRRSLPQKEMENSAQQVGNVYGAFEVSAPIPTGPVLLIDDIVDSRWTLTVVGVALREAGSGAVHPFVLAKAEGS